MNHTDEHEIKAGVDLSRIRATVAPVLHAQGVALADLEWLTDRVGWVLRISIERAGATDIGTGGVTLEDCVEVSRGVSAVLDADDFIHHHYHLEVSSPGVDRPLRAEADFVRFTGQTAKVKLSRPAPDGQRVLRGLLDAAPPGNVAVIVDGKRIEVPYADVAEANLVFELGGQAKGQPKKTAPAKSSNRGAKKSPRRSAAMGAPAPKSPARSS